MDFGVAGAGAVAVVVLFFISRGALSSGVVPEGVDTGALLATAVPSSRTTGWPVAGVEGWTVATGDAPVLQPTNRRAINAIKQRKNAWSTQVTN